MLLEATYQDPKTATASFSKVGSDFRKALLEVATEEGGTPFSLNVKQLAGPGIWPKPEAVSKLVLLHPETSQSLTERFRKIGEERRSEELKEFLRKECCFRRRFRKMLQGVRFLF